MNLLSSPDSSEQIGELHVWIDAWIGIHLFNHGEMVGLMKRGLWYRPNSNGYTPFEREAGRYTREEAKAEAYHPPGASTDEIVHIVEFSMPHYSTDPACSLEVLKKCAEKVNCHEIKLYLREDDMWVVYSRDVSSGGQCTLELAIALFAKELYSRKDV